jgi:hypothetical protein
MKNWDVGLRDLYDHENGRGHDKERDCYQKISEEVPNFFSLYMSEPRAFTENFHCKALNGI